MASSRSAVAELKTSSQKEDEKKTEEKDTRKDGEMKGEEGRAGGEGWGGKAENTQSNDRRAMLL